MSDKNILLSVAVITMLALSAGVAWADEEASTDASGSIVKWQQRPDRVQGINVISLVDDNGPKSMTVADDWLCLDGSPVTDLHFWGSYPGWYPDKVPRDPDTSPGIKEFRIQIYSDVPAVVGREGFSRPGNLIYEVWVDDFTETYVDSILFPWEKYEHKYRYDIDLPEPFPQKRGTIYWLNVAARPQDHTYPWGWESSMDRWNDFAVQGWYADQDNSEWDMIYHSWTEQPIDMAFELTTGEGPMKWIQFPDMANGANILSLPEDPVVADDWLCTDGKPITEVHFWGSYLSREEDLHWDQKNPGPPELPPGVSEFKFSFHKDVPAGTDPEMSWSHPGVLIRKVRMAPDEVKERYWDSVPHTDPAGNIWWEHKFYYIASLKEPFEQEKGTIYWLDIGAKPVDDKWYWGWETSIRHWNDNAVRGWNDGSWWECLGVATIDFEDLALGTEYKVGNTFTTSGVPVAVKQFQWSGGTWTGGGHATVENGGHAGGAGDEVNVNNVNLDFGFGAPLKSLTLLFGEYGGNLNIEINGDFRNFENFDKINGLTIGGVHVTVVGIGDSKGRLTLTGTIEQFALGGQELWIDDVEFVKRVDMAFALMTETVTLRMDWGDAPEGAAAPGYPTLLGSNGARHTIVPGLHLGRTIRVSQESSPGAGDFVANVLGYVSPYVTTNSTAGYYQYGTPHGASFNGPAPPLTSDRSHLFLADTTDGLSLFVVHDKPEDGSGGTTRMHWTLAGDTAGVLALDDPSETVTVSGGGTIFESSHGWMPCCTDGMAFGSLDGDWSMTGNFTNAIAETGMDEWHVHSPDSSSIALAFERDLRVRLDYCDPIDPEPDGQPDANALGDDNDGNDDENGVVFNTPLVSGQQAEVTVFASTQGILQAWIDFNADSDWADSGEQIFVNKPLVAGPNVLTFNVPATAVQESTFATFARFRFSRMRSLSFDGPARDGEVEDYKVRIEVRPTADLGDAPDSTNSFSAPMTAYPGVAAVPANFPTVYGAGSPPHGPIHHQPKALAFLGQSVRLESEADIGPDEDGCNNLDPQNDAADLDVSDDGVNMPLVLVHCKPNTFDYVVTIVEPLYRSVHVNVWFDWNRDGDWDDVMKCPEAAGTVPALAPEWAVQNQQLQLSGPGVFTFTTPRFMAWLPPQVEVEPPARWMRITLSEQEWAPTEDALGSGGSGPAGGYRYGETEDYYVRCVQSPPNTKWVQLPDLTPNGIDIKVDDMHILADDFECTSPSLLTDVHFWGSWKHDEKGEIKSIHLRIHSDDPVGIGGSDKENRFSKPDKQLWERDFSPGEFEESLYYTATNRGEWWWDPAKEELVEDGDKQVWRYDIKIDQDEAFLQRGTMERPVIYWLDIRVTTEDGEFGWKTRQCQKHFMDDAVWDYGSELPRTWNELRYPEGHPYHGLERDSIDMAFMLTFKALDWGDAPDPRYPTLLGSNGASHIISPGICLGRWVEADEDGQPSIGAIGDDIIDGTDDEDGVAIPPLRVGATTRIRVSASVSGYLNAWFDWNADGDWADRGEYVIVERPVPAGSSSHLIQVPGGAEPGSSYARFRFSTRPLTAVLPEPRYEGIAPDGEVEDYRFWTYPTGPDHFEPNNDFQAAFDLGSLDQDRTGLGIHESGEEDWFEWTALNDGPVNFSVNGDVTLELYDSGGNLLATTGPDKCIPWDVIADTSYRVRIRATDPGMTILDYGWVVKLLGDSDNYALLFSGGSTPSYNYNRYYNNIKEMYETVVNDYDVLPDNIWILYADGTDPAADQPGGVNSDMSYIVNGTTVISGTRANLESVLTTTLPGLVDGNDHFLFYAFDHGSGTSNAPATTGEEVLTGWSASTADNDLKDWLNQVGAGHTTVVHTQCFAGGMLDDLLPLSSSTFGCAATNHYESSWGDGFAGAFADALKSGYGNAHDAYVYAHDHDTYAITRGTYPDNGGTWIYGKEHPWAASTANFPIFVEEDKLLPQLKEDDMYRYPEFYIGPYPPCDPLRITHDMLIAQELFVDSGAIGMGFRVEAVNSGSLTKNGEPVVPGKTMIRYGESVVWTPPACINSAEESGEADVFDAFMIRAADGATVSDNSVTITIAADSAGELVAANDTVEIDEDERDVIIDVLANDSGNGTLVVAGVGQPQRGVALLAEGQVIYTPGPNFHGSDQFTYSVTDSALNTGTATVTVEVRSVNDPPEAYDDHLIVVMDSVNNTIDVLVNDYDLDPDPLTALPGDSPAHGSVIPNADGIFSYTPDAGYIGSDSFTYLADDGTDQSMATVMITVTEDADSDWGDAPEFSGSMGGGYPTRAASGGANHTIGGPWLGAMAPDGEADGQPHSVALGDNNNNIDDEDGVSVPGLQQGKTATIEIVVGGGGGHVDAWIDWNGNHLWEHPQEQIHAGHLPDGTHAISVSVPDAPITGQTFARFRISSDGGLTPGGSAPDGEVEDYEVQIQASQGYCECGDLNCDGVVTAADAVIALEIAAGSRPNDPAADVSGDGVVTSLDAMMILQAAADAIEIC